MGNTLSFKLLQMLVHITTATKAPHSVLLIAVVDALYRFVYADVAKLLCAYIVMLMITE